MSESLTQRIDRMFARDRAFAMGMVALLWVCVGFVYFAVDVHVHDGGIRTALVIGALLLLAFNTASIFAMVRHYAEDKAHIYGQDIRHMDQRGRS